MCAECVTMEDLQGFRIQLLNDLKQLFPVAKEKAASEEWLRSGEVRKILKVSHGTLQNLRIAGKLNPVKISGSWRYLNSEVQSLFNGSC